MNGRMDERRDGRTRRQRSAAARQRGASWRTGRPSAAPSCVRKHNSLWGPVPHNKQQTPNGQPSTAVRWVVDRGSSSNAYLVALHCRWGGEFPAKAATKEAAKSAGKVSPRTTVRARRRFCNHATFAPNGSGLGRFDPKITVCAQVLAGNNFGRRNEAPCQPH